LTALFNKSSLSDIQLKKVYSLIYTFTLLLDFPRVSRKVGSMQTQQTD